MIHRRTEANLDATTVEGFGREWSSFDQSGLGETELSRRFAEYFRLFPWDGLPPGAIGFDLGCGSGRWARFVAPRVGRLHCIDASAEALAVAERNLAGAPNCSFHHASVDSVPLPPASMDFGYSLGVLHHIPDTPGGIRSCAELLRPGAPLLVYIYYALENRPLWFRATWRLADLGRRLISRLPPRPKLGVTGAIAALVYFPLARVARLVERIRRNPQGMPLSTYRHASFYTMRTDALDRFGTRLEKRFTAAQVRKMMREAGLEGVRICDQPPFWCAVGYRTDLDDS